MSFLAAPIVATSFLPRFANWNAGYESWVALGSFDQFPAGQTRLATYRHPAANPSDGETANIPCWVRNVDGKTFQVFAINCAHLLGGWSARFPQSRPVYVPHATRWRLLCGRFLRARQTSGAWLV